MQNHHIQIVNALIHTQNAVAQACGVMMNSRLQKDDPLRRRLPAEIRGADILFSSNYATTHPRHHGVASIAFLMVAVAPQIPSNVALVYGQHYLSRHGRQADIDWLFLTQHGIDPMTRLANSLAVSGYFGNVGGDIGRERAMAVLARKASRPFSIPG